MWSTRPGRKVEPLMNAAEPSLSQREAMFQAAAKLRRSARRHRIKITIIAIILLAWAFFTIVPLYWMVVFVQRCIRLSLSATFLDTSEPSLEPYRRFLQQRDGGKMASKQPDRRRHYCLQCTISSMARYAFAKLEFPGRDQFSGSY